MNEPVQADNRPLLQRGCPMCGEALEMKKQIAPAAWVVFFLLALVALVMHYGLLLLVLLVPLAMQANYILCRSCGFKQKVG